MKKKCSECINCTIGYSSSEPCVGCDNKKSWAPGNFGIQRTVQALRAENARLRAIEQQISDAYYDHLIKSKSAGFESGIAAFWNLVTLVTPMIKYRTDEMVEAGILERSKD